MASGTVSAVLDHGHSRDSVSKHREEMNVAGSPSYTDDELANAVRSSYSWRGVLRQLGLAGTSAAAIRSIRHRANDLGHDYSHFRGQRGWDEDALRAAVARSNSWQEVADALGLIGGSGASTVRGHATRLGIDAHHIVARRQPNHDSESPVPQLANLHRAGPLLAAAWFTMCGYNVSWPLEPCRYDLLVERAGSVLRVQVKTATVRSGNSWTAWLSTTRRKRLPYDVDEIDDFFIINGDLDYYLIPVGAVGGLHAIRLSAYEHHRLVRRSPSCPP